MKKILTLSACLLTGLALSIGLISANPLPPIQVGPVPESLNDGGVGCRFDAKGTHEMIYLSDEDHAWMNLDGVVTELHETKEGHASGPILHYYSDTGHQVEIILGKDKEGEGGVFYPRMRFKISKNGNTRVIKASGGCGC